jgi:hypothetical protein
MPQDKNHISRTRTLQRQNAENLKQIFPEKEYRGLSPNFHIHVSVSELYIPTMGLPVLLEEICRLILGKYKSLKDTWMWKLGLRPRYSQKRKYKRNCRCSAGYIGWRAGTTTLCMSQLYPAVMEKWIWLLFSINAIQTAKILISMWWIWNYSRPRMIVKEGALLYQGVGGPIVSPIYLPM